jgi:DNA-binding NarL/FixJ family response regulator
MLVSALIAEDHDLTREGIRSLLENRLEARVAATTGDGLEVVSLLEEHNPDLLVLDLGLPHLSGLEILRTIRDRSLSVQVVVLSMHAEDAYVSDAFDLGVSAYVLKGDSTEELTAAIRAAVAGDRYLSSGLSAEVLASTRSAEGESGDRYERLTEREREVLQLTAEGYTSKEIGERLYISHRTVDKHRENIRAKLGLDSTVQMAAYAHRRGLIPTPPDLDAREGEADGDNSSSAA